MELFYEILVSALLVIAGVFTLIGSFGLLKLDDLMKRLHGPTKATTLGVGAALLASMAFFALFVERLSFHELLVTIFLFLTAPITANMIAKAHLHRHPSAEENLPDTSSDQGWATYHSAPTIKAAELSKES